MTKPFSIVRGALGLAAGAGLLLVAQNVAAQSAAIQGDAIRGDATPNTDEETRNKALIQRGFDAWAAGTGSPYDLLAEDATWTITGNSAAAGTYPSKEDFLREVIRPFNARMRSPLVPTVRRLYAEGDTVVAFFHASGVARDGERYANTYAWFMEMQDGQIVRANAFFDSIAFDAFWSRVTPAAN